MLDVFTPAPDSSTRRRIITCVGPLLLLYLMYTTVRFFVRERGPRLGLDHAHRVIKFEQDFGLNWEHALQARALHHEWFIYAANWYYVLGFLPVLVTAAIVSAWRAPDTFLRWRPVFAVSLVIAAFGYAFYPTTPPRMLPAQWGFTDTLLKFGPHYYGDASGASLFDAYGALPSTVNVYAAMPSMHVAWSVISGLLLAAAIGLRGRRALVSLVHPSLMAIAVVITANHYVLDVLVGLMVLLAATLLVRGVQRYRASDDARSSAASSQPARQLQSTP